VFAYNRGMSHTLAGITDLRLGTDLVYIPRLQTALSRYGQLFFARLLTSAELAYCFSADKRESISIRRAAGRIALKEAVSKALGTGLNGLGWSQGIYWQNIELQARERQAPALILHGKAKQIAEQAGICDWRVSLSHDGDYATATAIGLIRDP
jgi:holo-[acyl-carrier protein] synthase